MQNELVTLLESAQLKNDIPQFKSGDTINVHVLIREGAKERVQQFKGVCISRKNGSGGGTFTVRKISNGIGVERIMPTHSPSIQKIEVLKRGVVRRAKLFYLRGLSGKAARIQELLETPVKK